MTIENMGTFSRQLHDLLLKKSAEGQITATVRDIENLQLNIVPIKDELRWIIFNKNVSDQLSDDTIKEIEALWTSNQ